MSFRVSNTVPKNNDTPTPQRPLPTIKELVEPIPDKKDLRALNEQEKKQYFRDTVDIDNRIYIAEQKFLNKDKIMDTDPFLIQYKRSLQNQQKVVNEKIVFDAISNSWKIVKDNS